MKRDPNGDPLPPSRRPRPLPALPTGKREYVPTDSRDVTSELAAVSARGPNGAVSPVTAAMREALPRPESPSAIFARFQTEGGEAIAESLKARDEADAATAQTATDRAGLVEYETALERLRENRRLIDDEIERLERGASPSATEKEAEVAAPSATFPATPGGHEVVELGGRRTERAAPEQEREPVSPASPLVVARTVTTEDLDRLWDWIRADPDSGPAFLGGVMPTSVALHQRMSTFEVVRAVDVGGVHVGFFVLAPILADVAMLRAYTAPTARGYATQLLPYVLAGARREIPLTMRLAVSSARDSDAMERLLRPYGFAGYRVFLQEGRQEGGAR